VSWNEVSLRRDEFTRVRRSLSSTDPFLSFVFQNLQNLVDNYNGFGRGELWILVRSWSLIFLRRRRGVLVVDTHPVLLLFSSLYISSVAAAESEDGGGLAGRWWRGWANVSPLLSLSHFALGRRRVREKEKSS